MSRKQRERWRPIVGWEGLYDVSDRGRVRSYKKSGTSAVQKTPNMRKLLIGNHGYLSVNLSHNGYTKRYQVHRLVYRAFIGTIDDDKYIHHRDHDRTNAQLDNLEQVTPSQNLHYAVEAGKPLARKGENNGRSILTEEVVREIRQINFVDGTIGMLAKRYGVGKTAICDIKNGKSWRHVR